MIQKSNVSIAEHSYVPVSVLNYTRLSMLASRSDGLWLAEPICSTIWVNTFFDDFMLLRAQNML